MAKYKIVIDRQFHSLNEFIAANRQRHGNWSGGNMMKQGDQRIVQAYIRAHELPEIDLPVVIRYRYYCGNRKRDLDNISGYFHKIFQDALVAEGVLANDTWGYIQGFSDDFELDRERPRIEIEIEEIDTAAGRTA